MTLNVGVRRTMVFVGLILAAGLLVVLRHILPDWAFAAALALLAVEGSTIADKYAGNTISEAVWHLSERPLIPLLFGMALGAALAADTLSAPVAAGIGTVVGHFFWQSQPFYRGLWQAARVAGGDE